MFILLIQYPWRCNRFMVHLSIWLATSAVLFLRWDLNLGRQVSDLHPTWCTFRPLYSPFLQIGYGTSGKFKQLTCLWSTSAVCVCNGIWYNHGGRKIIIIFLPPWYNSIFDADYFQILDPNPVIAKDGFLALQVWPFYSPGPQGGT